MKENVIKEKNVKIPLYVTVYETISEWLKEGKYKPGDKLPGENILAEQLNVSRGTLRQAMLLLQEDGFIVNQQGRGNIVLSAQRPAKAGLEKIENPLVDFCLQPVDKVETTVGFQPATQKHQEVLKLRASSIVAVINITYYSGDTVVGFAMVYMPYEVLDKSSVDLEDPDTVYQFYSKLLTSGGPNHSTDTIMYYIYYTAFKLYRYGYGNAMGVVLAVIIAILSAVQFKLGNQDN